jgi:hypothetical protein
MEHRSSPSRDGSASHIDECAAQEACMAFDISIRAKVSRALRANNEQWSSTSWARKLALVQAEAASLSASLEAALARCSLLALFALQQRIIRSPDSDM